MVAWTWQRHATCLALHKRYTLSATHGIASRTPAFSPEPSQSNLSLVFGLSPCRQGTHWLHVSLFAPPREMDADATRRLMLAGTARTTTLDCFTLVWPCGPSGSGAHGLVPLRAYHAHTSSPFIPPLFLDAASCNIAKRPLVTFCLPP